MTAVKRKGGKIIAGLKDALAHAKGDKSRAKVTRRISKSSEKIIHETAHRYRHALKRLANK